MIAFRPTAKFDKEASVIFLTKEQAGKKEFSFSEKKLKENIFAVLKAGKFSGESDEIFPLVFNNKLVLLVGVGEKEKLTLTAFRSTARKAFLSSALRKTSSIEIISYSESDEVICALIEAVLIGTYAWRKYVSNDKDKDVKSADEKNFVIVAQKKKIYDETVTICGGVNLTRNLINDNADLITSSYLEKTVCDLIKGKKNISTEILGEKELKKHGLNLHLAVNQGSRKEPRLIIVKYAGNPKSKDYVALVGKGITFDTGGLNLKPTGSMETMRTDMSGAAAVIGALKSTLALGLKKNIIFVMTVAENVIGSGAFKPGDVIRGYSGKTVEIGNTDAEGRLVLADAIAYVVKNYKPSNLIDLATLTGACVVALGHDYSGLMSNNDELAQKILACAKKTDDRVWQLPIYPELKDHVKSLIADIKNTGQRGAAGALSAGEFLRQFVGETKWAHLDIAGTAFCDGAGRFYFGHGATGAGVRLLTEFLR